MPPADRANILESVKETRAMLTDPAFIKQRQDQLAAERAQESGGDAAVMSEVDALTPADPAKLFARRLREFLDATADVNVSARTINLTISPVASTASSSWTRPTGRGTGCGRKPRSFSIFIRTSPGLWLDCRGEVCLNARRVSNRWAKTSPPGFVPRPATPMRSPA
jgi:hypothetical protein